MRVLRAAFQLFMMLLCVAYLIITCTSFIILSLFLSFIINPIVAGVVGLVLMILFYVVLITSKVYNACLDWIANI